MSFVIRFRDLSIIYSCMSPTICHPRLRPFLDDNDMSPATETILGLVLGVLRLKVLRRSRMNLGVAAWERSVGRPSRNRLENGHANHHRYRITTPVLKMHLDRAATRISTYSVLAGRRWPPARQSQCRSRVARRACASSLRPTRYHRCGTADTPCRPKLNAIRRPGCTS